MVNKLLLLPHLRFSVGEVIILHKSTLANTNQFNKESLKRDKELLDKASLTLTTQRLGGLIKSATLFKMTFKF